MAEKPAGVAQKDVFKDNRWMSTHEVHVSEGNDKEPEVVFLGDSHIAWLEQTEVYRELFAPMHCMCLGGIGDTTENLLWRIQNGELDGIRPKVFVLMVGSFDVANSTDEIVTGIENVVKAIREKQPNAEIWVLKLFPSGRTPNPRRQLIALANEALEGRLKTPLTKVLDIDPGFISADGSIDRHDMFDFAHLSQEGYRKSFESLHLALQSILNPDQSIITE